MSLAGFKLLMKSLQSMHPADKLYLWPMCTNLQVSLWFKRDLKWVPLLVLTFNQTFSFNNNIYKKNKKYWSLSRLVPLPSCWVLQAATTLLVSSAGIFWMSRDVPLSCNARLLSKIKAVMQYTHSALSDIQTAAATLLDFLFFFNYSVNNLNNNNNNNSALQIQFSGDILTFWHFDWNWEQASNYFIF